MQLELIQLQLMQMELVHSGEAVQDERTRPDRPIEKETEPVEMDASRQM
jgi:hypothetical protein